MDYKELEEENKRLKSKLENIGAWMKIEIGQSQNAQKIYKQISQKIEIFFEYCSLDYQKKQEIFEHIANSEILFLSQEKLGTTDGFSTISGYLKALDIIIEETITKPYRRYSNSTKSKLTSHASHNYLEKSLYLTVEKGYSLSVGRLYELIEIYKKKEGKNYENYTHKFLLHLEASYIFSEEANVENISKKLDIIIKNEIINTKRHKGFLSLSDTKLTREILVGNFEDNNCVFSVLLR